MHELNLWKACQFKTALPTTKETYSFPKICEPVAAAYLANIARARGILLIPGHAFSGGMLWQKCIFTAREDVFGASEYTEEEFNAKQELLSDHAASLRKRELSKKTEKQSRRDFFTGSYNLEVFAKPNPVIINAIHDLLKSSLIQAWTAFEVLAEDLHRRVLEARPSMDTRSAWSSAERSNSSFRSRTKIANYYRWTFRVDNADILSALDNSSVHALAILRNSLVHCDGVVDKTFQDDRKGFFKGVVKNVKTDPRFPIPELKHIKGRAIGYRIPFSGEMVRSFVDPVTPLGFRLVNSVDEWLNYHK